MSKSDFKVIKHLGKGSYGSVSLVTRNYDGKQYALKDINVSKMPTRDKADQLNEIRILASLYHPNILGYYDAFIEGGHLYIVTEFADGGDVDRIIRYNYNYKTRIPENQVWSILIQALNALRLLHYKHILHRDIKAQNILVFRNPYNPEQPLYKIADFGVSKVMHENLAKTAIGTPYYLSPEIWRCERYNEKTDVYSLGCLIYELCMLKHPFSGRDMKDLQRNVLRGNYLKISDFYSQELRNLVSEMMFQQPVKRPTVQRLLQSDAIQQRQHLSPTKIETDVLPGMATLVANGKQSESENLAQPIMLGTIKINAGLNRMMQGPISGTQYGKIYTKPVDQRAVLPGDYYQKREAWNQLAGLHLEHVRSPEERCKEQPANAAFKMQAPQKTCLEPALKYKAPQTVTAPPTKNVPQRAVISAARPGLYDANGRLRASRRCAVQRHCK